MRLKCHLSLAILAFVIQAGAPALAMDFFINAQTGADTNPGTKAHPWRTIARANAQNLAPGDHILFARGVNYVGALVIRSSGTPAQPIVISAYGAGKAPRLMNPRFANEMGRIISVYGNYVKIERLYFQDTPTPPPDDPPLPWKESAQHKLVTELAAVYVDRQAAHVVIVNCEFVNTPIGVRLRGHDSSVLQSYFHDASKITEYWGAIGVAVVGPNNVVAYNKFENIGYYGGAYADDGAAVELDGEDKAFDAHHTSVHHNISHNTKGGFLEIAGNTHDVEISYNVSDDVDKFVGTNGIRNLVIGHNTIIRTRIHDISETDFWSFRSLLWSICFNGCDGDRDQNVDIRNNIFAVTAIHRLYLGPDNPHGFMSANRKDNLYFATDGDSLAVVGGALSPGEQIADPKFKNPASGDYRQIIPGRFGAFPAQDSKWTAGILP
jgi:hypothetical protein